MSAIYVLAGDERDGPFTIEEVRDKMAAGVYTPDTLIWQEGQEQWFPLSSLIEVSVPEENQNPEAAEEAIVLHESRQCRLTTEYLEFGNQAIPLNEMVTVEVEAEHTNRSRPVGGVILFSFLLLILLFVPLHLISDYDAFIRIGGSVLLVFLLIRSLLAALSPAQAIVSILLNDGEPRMLTLPHAEALVLIKALHEAAGVLMVQENE